MTPLEQLTTAPDSIPFLEEAQSLLKGVKCKRIPIIDAQGNLVSLICRRDILNQKRTHRQVDIPILTVTSDYLNYHAQRLARQNKGIS